MRNYSKLKLFLLASGTSLLCSQMPVLADGLDNGDSSGSGLKSSGIGASGAASGTIPSGLSTGETSQVSMERAQGHKLAKAMGHYSRARSLLIAAIQEFDQGYAVASPEAILDGRQWRADVIDRAQELERVLDPQPRISNSGVRFNADSRLLTEGKK